MLPSAKRLADRFLQRTAGFATTVEGGNFASDAWVAGCRAGKFARGRGQMPNPPDGHPQEFHDGYSWGFDNAPQISEID